MSMQMPFSSGVGDDVLDDQDICHIDIDNN